MERKKKSSKKGAVLLLRGTFGSEGDGPAEGVFTARYLYLTHLVDANETIQNSVSFVPGFGPGI